MAGEWTISAEGLQETRRAFNQAQRGMGVTVNQGLRAGLNRHTLPAARRAYLALGHVPGRRTGVGVVARNKGAGLVLRTGKDPWIAGAEFGAKKYRQFFPWVGNQYTDRKFPGYFAGPALQATMPAVERDLLDDIADAIEKRNP